MQVTVVTLLVTPEQSERLALASTEGKIQPRAAQPARHQRSLDARNPYRPASSVVWPLRPPLARRHRRRRTIASPATSSDDAGNGGAADRGNHPRRQAHDRNHQVAGTQMRRSRHMTRKFTSAVAGLILVILVAAPEARQQAAGLRTRRGSQRPARRRGSADHAGETAGRPVDDPRHWRHHHPRVADRAGHCRRDGDRADAAAHPRQAAGHDLDVRVGQDGGDQDLRGRGPQRSELPRRTRQAALPRRTDQRRRQRQGRRAFRHRDEQVRHRQGRGRGRRLRREEGKRRQPAQAAGGCRVEPGAAPRSFRRSQPQRAAGSRRRVLQRRQERPVRPRDDATVPGAPFRPQSAERGAGRHAGVQRLPESVPVRREEQGRCGRQGAADARRLPEPGRAESDRDERQGGQLPRRRRVSLSGSAGAVRQLHDPLQGVRRSTRASRRPCSAAI